MKFTSMKHIVTALALAWAIALPSARAEDTDLFVGASASAASNPNVLIIIDNSANWSAASQHWPDGVKQGQSELRALRNVVNSLSDKVNVGLMLFTEGSTANNPDGPGGYVRYHIRQMTNTNKNALMELIGPSSGCVDGDNSLNFTPNCLFKNFDTPTEKTGTSKTDYSETLFEAFKYFGGYTSPEHAHDDVAGSPVDRWHFGPARLAGAPDPKSDTAAYTSSAKHTYTPPISAAGTCAKNYIIFIGNGFPVQDSPSSLLSNVGGSTAQLVMQQYVTTSSTVNTNIGSGCGNNASACESGIPNALKDANPADSYSCINATTSASCPGGGNKLWQYQATRTVLTVTPTGTYAAPSNATARNADEWAKFLYETDLNAAPGQQNAVMFTIDVFKDSPDGNQTALLASMAKHGGGKYYTATSESEIESALRQTFLEIQSVNSTFASASLPISATNRTQNENKVYIGMFRPDPNAEPRWYGNLKSYQLGFFGGEVKLADAEGAEAVSTTTGFLQPCARSFWTTDSGTYWSFSPGSASQCATSAYGLFSDRPDGPQVEKGGAAEVLRKGNNPGVPTQYPWPYRSMYSCASVTDCTVMTSIYAAALPWDTTYHTIGWDVNDENNNPINWATVNWSIPSSWIGKGMYEMRPSSHGDVVHSRPVPVNYGGSVGAVLYYGANDGAFRAVRGSDGKELWSFIAPEHQSRLLRLRNNSPLVLYPNMATPLPSPTPTAKDYFFDGTAGLYQNADNSKVWLFPTMRRGGRMIYAFDIENPLSPDIKWRIGCPNNADDVGCTPGMEQIGQTWSVPVVAKIRGFSTTDPVILVGGGYDACEDADSSSPSCGSTKGNVVYVINADTGSKIAEFSTDRAVPADITAVDRDFDGMAEHAYVADAGGNLYRIDFIDIATKASLEPADWTITKIARTTGSSRKFLYGPAALPLAGKVYLTITTGDRERPLAANYPYTSPITNRAYMFIDTFTSTGLPVNLDGDTMSNFTTATTCTDTLSSGYRGWYFDLNTGQGEQGVTSTLIVGGVVYFSTNRPVTSTTACESNLGEARGYAVNLINASGAVGTAASCGGSRSGVFTGGGLPPSPVAGNVMIDGKVVPIIIGGIQRLGGASSPIGAQSPPSSISKKRSRQYWYKRGDK